MASCVTDDERRTSAEMMAKGTFGWVMLATKDLDGTFERVQASGAEVVQEPLAAAAGSCERVWRPCLGPVLPGSSRGPGSRLSSSHAVRAITA